MPRTLISAIAIALAWLAALPASAGKPPPGHGEVLQPNGGFGGPPVANLPPPPPTGLQIVTDPSSCTDHAGLGGGIACKVLLPKGGVALAFNYGGFHNAGFRAYELQKHPNGANGGGAPNTPAHTPLSTQTARLTDGRVVTLIVLEPRSSGYEDVCFYVTAFAGALESPPSNSVCAHATPTVKTVEFQPTHSLSQSFSVFSGRDVDPTPPGGILPDSDTDVFQHGVPMTIGYGKTFINTAPTYEYGVSRGAVLYDVGGLHGDSVTGAVLRLTRDQHAQPSCPIELDKGLENWWQHEQYPLTRSAELVIAGSHAGKTFDVDITQVARGWVSGGDNSGLALLVDHWPDQGYLLTAIVGNCGDTYLSIKLLVTYTDGTVTYSQY